MQPANAIVGAVRDVAQPLQGANDDYDALLELIGDARLVLQLSRDVSRPGVLLESARPSHGGTNQTVDEMLKAFQNRLQEGLSVDFRWIISTTPNSRFSNAPSLSGKISSRLAGC
jgi:hypothetical protein